jgi:signal transduction histidine kinase
VIITAACLGNALAAMIGEGAFNWFLVPVAIIGCVPLLWRRRYPFEVTLICGVCTVWLALAHAIGDLPAAQLVATYSFAALCTPTERLIGLAGTVIGVTTSMGSKITHVQEIGVDLALTVVFFTVAYALGVGARARRDRITMLEERAARLAEEQTAAATRERERIAREMHDILAHSISMIAIQAEAGPLAVRTDPAKAERMFDIVSETARESLAQLRRALGVLRAESDDPARRPAPGLRALDALVEDVRHAGLDVTLERDGSPRPISSDTEVAAYRIVQEALTNTVKHAEAGTVRVRLTWRDDALAVEVRDDGRGPAGTVASVNGAKGGHGLVGMRERVSAAGGDLVTGPCPDGTGYRVEASLPLDPHGP